MRFQFKWLLILLLGCGDGAREVDVPPVNTRVNYGKNIIVLADLSNRIINERRYEDPEVIEYITSNLKDVFQKSIERGVNDKFYLSTFNIEDFNNLNYNDSAFKIDLTRFNNHANARADYLHHNQKGIHSIQYDIRRLNGTFKSLYDHVKRNGQKPADIWYYFQDNLNTSIIDTTSWSYFRDNVLVTNKYNNYIIILTDGYIEAGRYGADMQNGNQYRMLTEKTVSDFRTSFLASNKLDYRAFFTENQYGIIPVNNPLLQDCKFLILEFFDRSVKNGVTTQTPTDAEIIKIFWKDWLQKSGVKDSNIQLKSTYSNKLTLAGDIAHFLKAD